MKELVYNFTDCRRCILCFRSSAMPPNLVNGDFGEYTLVIFRIEYDEIIAF
jgi:hypothetical protein